MYLVIEVRFVGPGRKLLGWEVYSTDDGQVAGELSEALNEANGDTAAVTFWDLDADPIGDAASRLAELRAFAEVEQAGASIDAMREGARRAGIQLGEGR